MDNSTITQLTTSIAAVGAAVWTIIQEIRYWKNRFKK